MDERVKGEYRKIYAELMMWIMIFLAGSLVVKFSFLGMGVEDCVTEFLILVLSPVYLAVRQYMLGLNPNEKVSKKARWTSFIAAIVGASVGFTVSALAREGAVKKGMIVNLLVFIAVFTFVYYVGRVLARYFADRKAKKYEE